MSRTQEAMPVLEELIELGENASTEKEDKITWMNERLLTNSPNKMREQYSALKSACLDMINEHATTLTKYNTMCGKYIGLQKENHAPENSTP